MGLILIHIHLQKLSNRAYLRVYALPYNHILHLLLKSRPNICNNQNYFSLDLLTPYQRERIKSPIIDMDNRFNKVFPSFNPYNPEFSPSFRIIDIFPGHFSFHSSNKYSTDNLISHLCQLNNLVIVSSEDPSYTLVVTNTSIKNNIAISITHIHICNRPVIKTVHHVVNVTSTEAELFAIRCGINQATNIHGILKIVVITNLIHSTQKFFDASHHPFQIHAVSILKKLRKFFVQNHNNSIKFWKCPSQCNWSLHKVINKETKLFKSIPQYPCKLSWDFSKKSE